MSHDSFTPHRAPGHSSEHVAEPSDVSTATSLMREGPRGALVLASISVALLFIGWLLFYVLLFLPRGSVG
jgi:hypothetical protein